MISLGESLRALVITIIASAFLIVLGIAYFGLTLWMIKTATGYFFGTGLDANWAVLSAALLSVGAILAGAIEKKPFKKLF